MKRLLVFVSLLLVLPTMDSAARAADPVMFSVTETAGLRRFGYPVTASLEMAEGVLPRGGTWRLLDAQQKEVAAQMTTMSQWPDGSVRGLDVDFVASVGPMESQSFRLEPGMPSKLAISNELSVMESAEEIIVASAAIRHRIRRDGKPLLPSTAFGPHEFLAPEGVVVTTVPGEVKVLKRGPFNVALQLGSVRLEYVNSKSWVKITQRSSSADDLAVSARFALPEKPLLWDFGVGSWLYGNMSKPGQTVSLRNSANTWQALTGGTNVAPSLYASGKTCEGWGHLADHQWVVAFGMASCSAEGEPHFDLNADGHLEIGAHRKELTVYLHFVSQPVAVTAVTSPQAMLSPLVVKTGDPGK